MKPCNTVIGITRPALYAAMTDALANEPSVCGWRLDAAARPLRLLLSCETEREAYFPLPGLIKHDTAVYLAWDWLQHLPEAAYPGLPPKTSVKGWTVWKPYHGANYAIAIAPMWVLDLGGN